MNDPVRPEGTRASPEKRHYPKGPGGVAWGQPGLSVGARAWQTRPAVLGPGAKIITYFGAIWDDAEEIETLARLSHPKVTIDTSGLSASATEVANRLADVIKRLDEKDLEEILGRLNSSQK